MSQYVLRVDHDTDRYVVWSTVVDAPAAYGNRADILEALAQERPVHWDGDPHGPEERVRRADDLGSSALWPRLDRPMFGWAHREEHPETLVSELGTLPGQNHFAWADLGTLYDRYMAAPDGVEPDVDDLIRPLEHEDD